MLIKFLQTNLNKEIDLVFGFDRYFGKLEYIGRDWWLVNGQAFYVGQVSSYGYLDNQVAYVVVR